MCSFGAPAIASATTAATLPTAKKADGPEMLLELLSAKPVGSPTTQEDKASDTMALNHNGAQIPGQVEPMPGNKTTDVQAEEPTAPRPPPTEQSAANLSEPTKIQTIGLIGEVPEVAE